MDTPSKGDYITLIHLGRPSENHARVERCLGPEGTLGVWRVQDETGEEFLITRNAAFDCERAKAWVEYRPNKYGERWYYDINSRFWNRAVCPAACRP